MHSRLLVKSLVPLAAALALGCATSPLITVPEPAVQDAPPPAPPAIPAIPPAGNLDPSAPLTPAQRRWIDSTFATLTLREKVGQLVHVWVLGDYTSDADSSWVQIREWLLEDGVGGVTMSLGSPIEVAHKVNAMQRLARVPLLVAADLEPGLGRLQGGVHLPYLLHGGSATIFPRAMAIGATGREEDAYDAARVIAREGRAIGININFAPTVDVNNNPANPVINTRSFGEDPATVARLSAAFVRGLQSAGMASTAKHFPGHGDTDTDTHLSLAIVPSNRARLDSVELVPFRAAIDAGVATFMTAHIALPALGVSDVPATLVPQVVSGLLRDSLGFEGLTFTDALSMGAIGKGYGVGQSAVMSIQAGNDILLKPDSIRPAIDAVVAAVEAGQIAAARIDSSVRRSLELKARTGVHEYPYRDLDSLRSIVGTPEHWAVAQGIADRAVTLIRDARNQVPLKPKATVTLVVYVPELEVDAGRIFAAELSKDQRVRTVRIGPQTGRTTLDSIVKAAARSDYVVVSSHQRRVEGEGRFAVAERIAAWIDTLAARRPVVVVAHGNPYVIRQFPNVTSYVTTYAIDPSLERASARALWGKQPITGKAPISLPGFFQRGDGIQREAVVAAP